MTGTAPPPFLPSLDVNMVSGVIAAILCLWTSMREGTEL